MKNTEKIKIGSQPMNQAHAEILDWLNSVKFKRGFFGGLDEIDVWKKIRELNSLYEKLLIAQEHPADKDEHEDEQFTDSSIRY